MDKERIQELVEQTGALAAGLHVQTRLPDECEERIECLKVAGRLMAAELIHQTVQDFIVS